MNSMAVTWEAEYHDGTVLREANGAKYEHIDRDRLASFRMVGGGEVLVAVHVKPGQNGHGLAYRRRTLLSSGQKVVWFVMGILPNGPVVAYQPETDEVHKSDSFQEGSGPLGKMEALPFERWSNTMHTADAVLKPTKITLPSGYVLSV